MANILLVDDDQLLREINGDILRSEGHAVTVSVDGEDAFEKIKQTKFDLILLDVILPKLTGFDVAAKARQELNLTTPIIFLTNADDPKDKLQAQALGGEYAMKSSLMPPDLINLVKKYIH